MKKFTDIFVHRPVLATVISLLIFLVGLRCLQLLTVREYPELKMSEITVTTTYPGANAQLVKSFVTTPLQTSIAGADGIDYLTASSTDSISTINAFIKLGYNSETAFTDIMSKVSEARQQLPNAVYDPVIKKQTGSSVAPMYIGFFSDHMSSQQIYDYLQRIVQPKLDAVQGLAEAQIMGTGAYAMRIWMEPQRMAALGVTTKDVSAALSNNNVQAASGMTKGKYVTYTVFAKTGLETAKQFKNLVVKEVNGTLIRLGDVAKVQLGASTYSVSLGINGKKAVVVAINVQPTANSLTVLKAVKKLMPSMEKTFPPSLKMTVIHDESVYIGQAIDEVIYTIVEAAIIVMLVIFLFLGSLRTVLIPLVTIPLSLIGVGSVMLALGFSTNLLTLLAMVLAIGMVVDDAIVVVENIYRHIEKGIKPFEAAIQGAREIATPVITMSITLAAVYAPIGLMGGMTGALFTQFAFTLAGAVILSGVIALTLSPMMCSKVLSKDLMEIRFVNLVDAFFIRLKTFYKRHLHSVLEFRSVVVLFAAVVLGSCYFLYSSSKHDLAPHEDLSGVWVFGNGPEYANLDYLEKYVAQVQKSFMAISGRKDTLTVSGFPTSSGIFSGLFLKPWNERKQTDVQIAAGLNKSLTNNAGLRVMAVTPSPLPSMGGMMPVQFVLTSISSYQDLWQAQEKLYQAAMNSHLFMFLSPDWYFDKPQLNFNIDRDKAGQMGINMQDLSDTLGTALAGSRLNYFSMGGWNYEVIPQLQRKSRYNPENLLDLKVSTSDNQKLVPLSSFMNFHMSVVPSSLNQFQQLNSITLSGMMMPGKSTAQGLKFLRNQATKLLPSDITYDYSGSSRQLIEEGSALTYTIFFSLVVIFLVLAAQFESFRDPFIVLISVPMSICGALIFINLGFASVNIYTQIGFITLMGLISKHGILMVDFANHLQKQGMSIRDAIEEAASVRLRPILMTTAAMVLGVVPLLLAVGPGSGSRFAIGLVISTGMLIGTLFTLFVVPTMYTLIAKRHTAEEDL